MALCAVPCLAAAQGTLPSTANVVLSQHSQCGQQAMLAQDTICFVLARPNLHPYTHPNILQSIGAQ